MERKEREREERGGEKEWNYEWKKSSKEIGEK